MHERPESGATGTTTIDPRADEEGSPAARLEDRPASAPLWGDEAGIRWPALEQD